MRIASDEIHHLGDRLIIHAAEAMDWPIREFCRVPIFFQGEKYYVRCRREDIKPYKFIYELWLWQNDMHEASIRSVVYDESYIAARNETAATMRRHDRFHFILFPFYPVLGLFWSAFKNNIFGPIGFVPKSITNASIALTFNLFVVEGIFVGWLGGGILTYCFQKPALHMLDWAALVLFGVDTLMRFSQSLQFDVERFWGFCEWLSPGKR